MDHNDLIRDILSDLAIERESKRKKKQARHL